MVWRLSLCAVLAAGAAFPHPMGTRSVSHYTLIEADGHGAQVTYLLELGEVPTYQLLKEHPELRADAYAVAQGWINGLEFLSAGRPLKAALQSAQSEIKGGTDGLSILRMTVRMTVPAAGSLQFEDHNFPDRSGWKEILIRAAPGTAIIHASHPTTDRSRQLTRFEGDPPNDLRAEVEWTAAATSSAPPSIQPIPQPAPVMDRETPKPADSAVQRDFLAGLLGKKEIGWGLALAGLAAAFGLGAMHALSPGHGKTIVAAYLVGSRGSMRHAALLGGMVTFTHTASVFALGLTALFLSEHIPTERIAKTLGVISGLSIVAVGAWLFWKRYTGLRHDWQHAHGRAHHHHHGDDHHHHHGHAHSHVPEGEITLASLIALGASGGLAPCPSALVLLLSSIALGRAVLGLILLIAFSAGLAGVLTAIGMIVLYAKHWLPDAAQTSRHGFFRLVPVLSAGIIVCVGVVMTGVSMGWIRAGF